jgi:hypothetical protein
MKYQGKEIEILSRKTVFGKQIAEVKILWIYRSILTPQNGQFLLEKSSYEQLLFRQMLTPF